MTEPVAPQPRRVSFVLPVYKPIATWVLLGIIVVMFGVETLAGGSTQTDVLIRLGAKVTPYIAAGEYWRLLTSMFLHIGFAHLLFNGYALLAIGTELERLLGWKRFLTVYLLSGLLGSLASYAFSANLAAGASGAIFGLIGALAAFFALHHRHLGSWGQRRLANIAFLIAVNLFFGFTQDGIDNWAHLGGLVSGLAVGWALAPRYRVGPLGIRLVDHNRLARYWPALVLAVAILVEGVALTNTSQRDSPQSHLWLATYAIEREAWGEAVVELEQALGQDPTLADADLYFQLGLAHNYLENWDAAIAAYRSALEIDPAYSPSYWGLANAYLQMERYDQALVYAETYAELNPDDAEAYFYLGLAHTFLGHYSLAAEAYESALVLAPDHSSAHWNLAFIYLELNRRAEAEAHFEAYLELNPDKAFEVRPYLEELRGTVP